MTLEQAIAAIEKAADDPKNGLPEPVFELVTTLTPMVNVDLLVRDECGRVLLSWRDDRDCGRGWHVPGGIVRYKETMANRIAETASREFGVGITFDPNPLAINEVFIEQAVRGHFVAFLFACTLPDGYTIPPSLRFADESDPDAAGRLQWHAKNPGNLVPGQRDIYRDIFI